jgi:hypothetical protein
MVFDSLLNVVGAAYVVRGVLADQEIGTPALRKRKRRALRLALLAQGKFSF